MAARRLLIVMLILLGLSTLAAALIPQRALRNRDGTQATTQATTTTTATAPPSGRALSAKIFVGGRKVPLVAGPVCAKRESPCEPIHVGDSLSLRVGSKDVGVQLQFPEFGQFGFASPASPAYFELLLSTAGRFGILYADPELVSGCHQSVNQHSPCVAARIEVLTESAARKALAPPAKSRARAGSGRA